MPTGKFYITDDAIPLTVSGNLDLGTITSPLGTLSLGYSSPNITADITGGGLKWNVVTSATNPNSILAQNGYISKGAGAVTFVLPATASIGDIFVVMGYGNLWTLTQNVGQTIYFGSSSTTPGIGGSLSATNIKDTITLTCVTTNTEFQVSNGIGNITVV